MIALETASLLYLFFDRLEPRFLVSLDPRLDGLRLGDLRTIRMHDYPWQDYDRLHRNLHLELGNHCNNRLNERLRRNGRDSAFSALVRNGPDGQGGCYDTPLNDLDVIAVEGFQIVEIWERKHPTEEYTKPQQQLHENIRRKFGVDVIVDRR